MSCPPISSSVQTFLGVLLATFRTNSKSSVRAHSIWHAELNAPAINIERDYVGTPSEAAQHSLSKCTKAIAEAYGKRLFITNNIEYIEHLESLDSMVRGTVLEFHRAIDAAVKNL